jgi:radical SAM superfamily enzyme YgiQ (UPF0313 family)
LAVARDHGHAGTIFDPSLALYRRQLRLDEMFYRNLAWLLLNEEPDVLGFTTLGCNLICTAKVAGHIKKQRPGLPVLLGGPHATILHREHLEHFEAFDVIVRGEAEAILPPLLERSCISDLSEISGLSYREGTMVVSTPASPQLHNLDDLPLPAYDLYPIRELGLDSLRVEAGRGCPFSCSFCSTASFFGRRYRLKSSDRLVSELDHLNRTYGISDFALTHDMFTANKNKVRHFCDTVAGRGYTWSCSARMDCVDASLLSAMYDAGCRSIYFGVETGSARMQKITRKHLDLDLVHPILDVTCQTGMRSTVSMITGYPEETGEDQEASLDMLGECFKRSPELVNLQLHLLTPEPGTALHEEYGERLMYDGHISDFNFPTLEADDSRTMREHPELFMNHHYYPTVLPRSQHIFVERSFPLLCILGHPLLRRMIDDFGGRLSSLIHAMRTFAGGQQAPPPDGQLLISFVEQTWGRSHPFASAVRFHLLGDRLRANLYTGPTNESDELNSTCRLSPSAALLHNVHDVPSILATLQSDTTALDLSQFSPDRTLLLFIESSEPNNVRSFEVGGIAHKLLVWLNQPRSIDQVSQWLGDNDDDFGSLRSFLSRLRRTGILLAPKALEPAWSADRSAV